MRVKMMGSKIRFSIWLAIVLCFGGAKADNDPKPMQTPLSETIVSGVLSDQTFPWKSFADELLSIFESTPFSSLEEVNSYCQANFLRPRGAERMSEAFVRYFESYVGRLDIVKQQQIMQLFEDHGFFRPVDPEFKTYDIILVLGATLKSMRFRLHYLNKLLCDGQIAVGPQSKIVFLSGDRDLFESESKEKLLDPSPYPVNPNWVAPDQLPTNETELAPFIWNQMVLCKKIRDIDAVNIKAPRKTNTKRATTIDTLVFFLDTFQTKNANVLVVSSNPYVLYQGLTAKTAFANRNLPIDRIDVVGPAHDYDDYSMVEKIGVALDSFARALYQYMKLQEARQRNQEPDHYSSHIF